jgi:hypothetical protein
VEVDSTTESTDTGLVQQVLGASVWYKWTAPSAGGSLDVSFDTESGGLADVTVYRDLGGLSTLVDVTTTWNLPEVDAAIEAGDRFVFRVSRSSRLPRLDFVLTWELHPPEGSS